MSFTVLKNDFFSED